MARSEKKNEWGDKRMKEREEIREVENDKREGSGAVGI